TLLAADPSDRRVRNLLREAERDQVAALYEELSPVAVPRLLGAAEGLESAAGRRLLLADREVAGRINGRWDVASIALACPLREVEPRASVGDGGGGRRGAGRRRRHRGHGGTQLGDAGRGAGRRCVEDRGLAPRRRLARLEIGDDEVGDLLQRRHDVLAAGGGG